MMMAEAYSEPVCAQAGIIKTADHILDFGRQRSGAEIKSASNYGIF